MKVVPVSLSDATVWQIDVLGPRSSVIRQIVEDYCAQRAKHGLASAIEARRAATSGAVRESAVGNAETPQLNSPSGASHD